MGAHRQRWNSLWDPHSRDVHPWGSLKGPMTALVPPCAVCVLVGKQTPTCIPSRAVSQCPISCPLPLCPARPGRVPRHPLLSLNRLFPWERASAGASEAAAVAAPREGSLPATAFPSRWEALRESSWRRRGEGSIASLPARAT